MDWYRQILFIGFNLCENHHDLKILSGFVIKDVIKFGEQPEGFMIAHEHFYVSDYKPMKE